MTYSLTPEKLVGMYNLLRMHRPFSRWRLPHSDAVEFRATARKDVMGEHRGGDPHVITVSCHTNTTFVTALMTLAHEMIHVAEDIAGKPVGHGAGFRRRVRQVARELGLDEKAI